MIDGLNKYPGASAVKIASTVLTAVLVVLYPIAIWIGLTHLGPRVLGLFLVALLVPVALVRFRRASREDLGAALRVPLAILTVVALSVVFDDPRFVLAMPVLINLVLLATFASSLVAERTIVERFARIHRARLEGTEDVTLSAAQIAHCRQATWAWCVFFLLNAAVAGVLALRAPMIWWAAYTSGIAYALMGLLFAAEWVVRQYRFRHYGTGLHDRLLSRILPPHEPPS
jgi:uncharacterized membrane protein